VGPYHCSIALDLPAKFGSAAQRHRHSEQTVEPEAVIARFVERNHIHAFLQFSSNARPNPLDGLQRVATNLVRQGCVGRDNPTFSSIRLQKNTGVIIGCGGWRVHRPGFHQSILLCAGGKVGTEMVNLRPSRLHRIYPGTPNGLPTLAARAVLEPPAPPAQPQTPADTG
jgi:hypothetical protein